MAGLLMNYCAECGTRLELKKCKEEGLVPYCKSCEAFRFPVFNTAISTVLINRDKNKVLLIQQYGKTDNILVAGYINKGESAEHALAREVMEEMGMTVAAYRFMKSEYYPGSNTLIFNYISMADSEDLSKMTEEVDRAGWYSFEEGKRIIKPGSLAERFYHYFLESTDSGKDISLIAAGQTGII
ncbi:NAD(+) diphosphatase [Anaerocolumna xylanovorans]|uniref:NAD(+) diphosphatase n=1 Tax=Anaerocolumna xylanovorans DSM 12503 TaxID=1121345 RepID=A0A1M7Y723_9FIRM|nr:NUDIX domain-containing protein [Anaerocolumna xylanovorans]SHO48447.1 NAD+ diphosphatase [Anaerocolumna xylanovorans DSM 12503]